MLDIKIKVFTLLKGKLDGQGERETEIVCKEEKYFLVFLLVHQKLSNAND